MKTLLVLLICLLSVTYVKGQVTLDKHYDNSCVSTKINAVDYKLFLMDVDQNQCRIYNTDHSHYKTINLSVPANMYLYDVRFVTEDLFHPDSKIELLYVYYEYIITSISEETGYYKYYTKLINEDGVVYLDAPGGLYSYMYLMGDKDYRLFLYSYDYSTYPYAMWTDLYKVPGIPHFLNSDDNLLKSGVMENAYPNPAKEFTTIGYALPEGVFEANLSIYTMGGKQISTYKVDKNFKNIRIQTGTLLPGNYLYYIETETQKSEAKKLIIH